MFVAVYRARLKPGREDQYADAWREATQVAIDHDGSGGSALFKGDDGLWTAIARWPDRGARQRFFEWTGYDHAARARQAEAVAERLPTLELDCVDDLWTAFP
ncbi:MAG: antibiotic biosynthesis monooxygenase [Pseudomonadota bacterium]